MNDDNGDDKRRWLSRLLSRLPVHLRPNSTDQRFQIAAHTAYRHGWEAEQLAEAVEARDYTGLRNPIGKAIERIEDLAHTPPASPEAFIAATEAHCGKPDCLCQHAECFKGWIEMDDTTITRTFKDEHHIVSHKDRPVTYRRTAPCRACRPQLAQRIAAIPPPGLRTPADISLMRRERTLP